MPNNNSIYINEIKTLSLLSATTGQLEIAKIPVVDKPDWIIPRSLILAIDSYPDRIWTYMWQSSQPIQGTAPQAEGSQPQFYPQKQEVAVYHLFPKNLTPESIVVVESFTDVHRIGLQIIGEVQYHQIRIADLKDADTSAGAAYDGEQLDAMNAKPKPDMAENAAADSKPNGDTRNLAPQAVEQTFIFQPVMFQGELCVVPDLDKLSHYLVDLDSD